MTRLSLATRSIVLFLLVAASFARADTSLTVDIGWGGYVRSHRWAPIVVTASDPITRNVVLKVRWPHGGNYEMNVEQVFGIGSVPRSYSLLLPVQSWYGYQEAMFSLADADTGKTLADYQPNGMYMSNMPSALSNDGALVGVSGRRTMLDSLRGNRDQQQLGIAYISSERLPAAALGYDSLELLVLNQPNLGLTGNREEVPIDPAQQQAILDWVRVGGNLMIWPSSTSALADSGAIAEALPCRPGAVGRLKFQLEDLMAIGLSQRFAALPSYALTPTSDAKPIQLFNGAATAYSRRFGLGRIVVVPFCVSDLQFTDNDKADRFWRNLLGDIHVLPELKPDGQPANRNFSPSYSHDENIETQAGMSVADRLGDVPGAGQFGFSYVVIVLIGMMVVVGPIDWFVLKKLGRQPWTWVTTSGWILLITLSATSLGYVLKSGDLHFRTMRLIDQIGDSTAATTDWVGIYSPMTREYALATEPDGWWQPAGVEGSTRTNSMATSTYFHQTYEGNVPEPMRINVWSLRFMSGEQVGVGPAAIVCSLTRDRDDHIIGSIKNLTDHPLKNLRVRVGGKIGEFTLRQEAPATLPTTAPTSGTSNTTGTSITAIAPLTSARVEATLLAEKPVEGFEDNEGIYPRYRGYTPPMVHADLWQAVNKLDTRRSKRIDELIAEGTGYACVWAEADDPSPAVRLSNRSPIQQHWQFIRALIELRKPGETR